MQRSPWLVSAMLAATVGCSFASASAQQPPTPPRPGTPSDTLDPNFVPLGFGSLKQDEIAMRVSPSNGLQIRAVPLDERLIRLLSPDSYRSLSELQNSKLRAIQSVKDRIRLPSYSIWYVSFFALEQGETRFSPNEFIINNVGRDFRPIDILPLSTGFGENRLNQRQTQSALFIFDGQLDINQPLTVQMEGTPSSTDWNEILRRVERERALVRSRAAAKAPAPVPVRVDSVWNGKRS